MNKQFQLTSASVIGREHRRSGRNNQDGFYTYQKEEIIVAIACDGCGSGRYSEVGAKLGCQLVGEVIFQTLSLFPQTSSEFWLHSRQEILTRLNTLVKTMGGHQWQIINDYFLFTIVGTLITPQAATVFTLGDGVIIVNGEPMILEFPGNAPPYLAYALEWNQKELPDELKFQIHYQLPISEVRSILIGTDGVADLMKVSDRPLPGKNQLVGDISQFWEQDSYFSNPDKSRRQLSLINREMSQSGQTKEVGLLPDDTTLIVIRQIP